MSDDIDARRRHLEYRRTHDVQGRPTERPAPEPPEPAERIHYKARFHPTPHPEPTYTDRAACRGLAADIFYPENGASSRQAKAICSVCPVRRECLEFALDNAEMHGVWGGKSARQRRAIRRAGMRA